MKIALFALVILFLIITGTIMLVIAKLFRQWIQCLFAGAPVPAFSLVGMRLRRSPVKLICEQRIRANYVGVELSCEEIERAHLKGADVKSAVDALCLAKRTDREVHWDDLIAIESEC